MIVYIKESKKNKKFLKNIKIKLKCIFNKIDIINNEEKIILCLPVFKEKKLSKYRIKRLTKSIINKLEQNKTSNVVLSNYLNQEILFKNYLYSNNINILDGRFLFKCLYSKIIEYILNIKKEKIQNSEIWITLNDFTDINKEIIIDIAKNVKTLNIITNSINKFRKIEKILYNEYGILLNITNNKKTSLLKAKIILNLDFPEEIINQYKINTKAIIINIQEKIEIKIKKFNGVNVNYYNINIPNEYKLKGFKEQEIYESIIYNFNTGKIQEKIEEDNIYIKNLIGNKGIINKQEFI